MSFLSRDELAARRQAELATRRRRRLGGLAVVVLLLAAAVAVALGQGGSQNSGPAAERPGRSPSGSTIRPRHVVALRVAPAHPGRAHVIFRGSRRNEIALTFDDGFCASCVARIIHTLARTGTHATIFPNGRYSTSWDPVAPVVRKLVSEGQLTIGNHTFMHHDAREESPAAFEEDLSHDERWIEQTFGVSARPFFRPPYGAYDSTTLAIAGRLGYTKVIYWSGTVADSSPRTPGYILGAIRYWARPGSIILMHGNYPATSIALPQILAILRQRHLRPVTLAQLLG